ncbi:MAG: hypothetical protein HOO91_17000 [Bacteroidales bacterium]|nr:hypothetical protein [Bacteroidales bacterium]
MKTTLISTSILLVVLISCTNPKIQNKSQAIKLNRLRHIIHETKFIALPYVFDATRNHIKGYHLDASTPDSLVFSSSCFTIINCFPDTTNYFAFLFGESGDMLYPGIITFDKSGKLISKEIISTCNCLTNPRVDTESCFDSVIIGKDLSILSYSKLKATIQPFDTSNVTFDASSEEKLTGRINSNGLVEIEKGEKK